MKKITLMLASVVMLSSVGFAQEKACCKKKGEKCAKEGNAGGCCKDKKKGECAGHKEANKDVKKEESAKKSS
jgi:hypothetical protein